MKYLVAVIAMMFALGANAEAEMKKVCHEKDGKQVCKTIKVHKKADKVTTGNPTDPEPKKDTKKK
jgi:hypothetical protein